MKDGAGAVDAALHECAQLAAEHGDLLSPVAAKLRSAAARLAEPLRLAVAGQIKRGKSTLVNALLCEDVAVTGQLELTFTVSEFRHGAEPAVFVHYRDHTVDGPLPPDELAAFTVRNPARLDQLRRIAKVEYAMPNELLRSFRLVDTPGLGSVHSTDSQNALDFLGVSSAFADTAEREAMERTMAAMGRTGRRVHQDTVDEIESADAVLYVFSGGLNERDYETVAQFVGPTAGGLSPLRAFAVLSNCDYYWPPDPDQPGSPSPVDYDPMAAARKIADRHLAEPEIRRVFFTILPVSGLVAVGARNLTLDDFALLGELGKADLGLLARKLGDAAWFAGVPEIKGVTLAQAERRRLIELLGGWGTFRACKYLKEFDGDGLDLAGLQERLIADSGLPRLRELVEAHFGNRAAAIKLDSGLRDIAAEIGRCRLGIQRDDAPAPEASDVLDTIAERVEQLRLDESESAAMAVLIAYYNAELSFSAAELAQVLAVTGEYGTDPATRLGLPADTPVVELRATAVRLAGYWALKESDPGLGRADRRAAVVVRRCYDRLLDALKPET